MQALAPSKPGSPPTPHRVLVHAPVGRDGALTCALLRDAAIDAHAVAERADLRGALDRGASVLILTEEALTTATLEIVEPWIAQQEPWSDLPVVLFIDDGHAPAEIVRITDAFGPSANVTFLERPLRPSALVSVVRSALKARARQYEVRDLLVSLRRLNDSLEQRVEDRTSEVRALATALTLAEQRERERISQVLHDGLQQLLFALQIKLQLFGVNRADALLEEAETLLQQTLEVTRTLTVELHPPVLDDDGLTVALEWLASHFEQQYDLRVEVEADGPCPVPRKEIRTLLTQSVRELLFNVVKHANVDRAHIHVRTTCTPMEIVVEDEGEGFPTSPLPLSDNGSGVGLSSLRDRLGLLGGRLEVQTRPGNGTRVVLTVPEDRDAG